MRYVRNGLCYSPLILASALFLVWAGCMPDEKDEREIEARIIHSAPVLDVAFSPNGNTLASASEDDTVRLLDVAQLHLNFDLGSDSHVVPQELPISPFVGHGYGFTAVDFSPEGLNLAAACTDIAKGDVIRVWDLITGQRIIEFDGHGGPIRSLQYGLVGSTLASGAGYQYDQGEAFVWEFSGWPDPVVSLGDARGPVHDVKFSPDGSMLATAWDDGVVRIWDTTTWEILYQLQVDDHVPYALAFTPNGNFLASAGDDSGPGFDGHGGVIRFWDLEDGHMDSALDLGTAPIHAIAYSPDGAVLALGGDAHRIHVIDAWNGTTVFTLRGHSGRVNDLEFSSNGQIMASGSDDKFIRFWYVGDVVGHTCEDGIDNDGDGWLDDDDPDCVDGDYESGFGTTECNDDEDNDDDGLIDSADPGCEDGMDDDEADDAPDGGPDGGEPDGGEPDGGDLDGGM